MSDKKIYPSQEIHVKEKLSPYLKYEELEDGYKVYIQIPNKYDVELIVLDLMPGVTIIAEYSNLSDYYKSSSELLSYEHPEDNLLINFIAKGQCQLEVGPDKYMFIKENDINIYLKELNPNSFNYIGEVTIFHIIINKRQFKDNFPPRYKEYCTMVDEIFEKSSNNPNIIFKSSDKIIQIVNEIIEFEKIKKITFLPYLRLKTLEALIILYEKGIHDEKTDQRTYSDATIRVVRNIKNSLSRNIASYVSLDQLAMTYGMNLTTLKNCFKDMYGKPIYTWYKEYKFYRARELIKNTDYPISKIAHMIGYKSSSKFAKAFKKEMGVLPSSYRKNKK